jgi:hypothetical protein
MSLTLNAFHLLVLEPRIPRGNLGFLDPGRDLKAAC